MAIYTAVNDDISKQFKIRTGVTVPATPTSRSVRKTPLTVGSAATGGVSRFAGEGSPKRFIDRYSNARCDPGLGDEFFNKIYVLPRSIDAGIIISDLVFGLDIYSSYRVPVTWTGYDDSILGTGVDIETPVPGAPIIFPPQSGALRDLTLDDIGPPKIDGNIVFTFDVGGALLPVTGSRSQFLPYEPDGDLTESLIFVTDILGGRSGPEQRRALRPQPRSLISYDLLLDEEDLQKMENQIFDGQNRAFGIGLWHQTTRNTVAVIPTDTSITVQSTAYADYRVGGLAVTWVDPFDFEVLQIGSIGPTSITFNSPFTSNFPIGVKVMPISTSFLGKSIPSSRHRMGLSSFTINALVLDNTANLADASAYSTYDGKIFLDDLNFLLSDQLNESFDIQRRMLDNRTGTPTILGDQATPRRGSSKGFITSDRQSAWEVRQLLHELKGRQTSFYMPSWKPDLTPVASITSAGSSIDVVDVQYSTLVRNRQPRNVIRVVLKDGTVSDPKEVTGSSIPVAGTDRLDITPDTWGITVALADIERVEYVHKVRLDSDTIRMRFSQGDGNMRVGIQTKEVLD